MNNPPAEQMELMQMLMQRNIPTDGIQIMGDGSIQLPPNTIQMLLSVRNGQAQHSSVRDPSQRDNGEWRWSNYDRLSGRQTPPRGTPGGGTSMYTPAQPASNPSSTSGILGGRDFGSGKEGSETTPSGDTVPRSLGSEHSSVVPSGNYRRGMLGVPDFSFTTLGNLLPAGHDAGAPMNQIVWPDGGLNVNQHLTLPKVDE